MLVNKLGVDVLLLMLCRLRFCKSFQSDNYVYYDLNNSALDFLKLQLHDAIYLLRFYSNSLIHILSLSNWHNNVASIEKNRDDKLHHVIVALSSFIEIVFKL